MNQRAPRVAKGGVCARLREGVRVGGRTEVAGRSWYTGGMSRGKLKCVVKRSRTGLGLFAVEDIPAGKRIIEYVGPLVPNEEVERRRGRYFFGVNSKWTIDGSPRSNLARYINHSCKPNTDAFVTGRRVWLWSKRDIKAGEELTCNYGKEYFDDYIKPVGCKCVKCLKKS